MKHINFFLASISQTFFPLTISILLLVPQVVAQEIPNAEDQDAIRAVIQAQLEAFQADDAERAFSFASPDIQSRFGSPANFLAMVKASYKPVYRPRSTIFKKLVVDSDMVVQQVLLVDTDNRLFMAIYPMEKQSDGSWRIAGCYLTRPQGVTL